MPIDLAKYEKLRQAVQAAKSEADKAQGALDGVLARLRTEFNVDGLPAAERLASQLEIEAAIAETEYNDALAEFETKWKERL